jgi:hypothetical protein
MAANAPLDRFPHTYGLLAIIWRQNNPNESPFEASVVDANLLNKATSFLKHEQGEELKTLLKDSFGCPDDVGSLLFLSGIL